MAIIESKRMNRQAALSLAIQALNERKDKLLIDNGNVTECGQFAKAIQECEQAIVFLTGYKIIDQYMSGYTECNFTIEIIEGRCILANDDESERKPD